MRVLFFVFIFSSCSMFDRGIFSEGALAAKNYNKNTETHKGAKKVLENRIQSERALYLDAKDNTYKSEEDISLFCSGISKRLGEKTGLQEIMEPRTIHVYFKKQIATNGVGNIIADTVYSTDNVIILRKRDEEKLSNLEINRKTGGFSWGIYPPDEIGKYGIVSTGTCENITFKKKKF